MHIEQWVGISMNLFYLILPSQKKLEIHSDADFGPKLRFAHIYQSAITYLAGWKGMTACPPCRPEKSYNGLSGAL